MDIEKVIDTVVAYHKKYTPPELFPQDVEDRFRNVLRSTYTKLELDKEDDNGRT